MRLFGKNHNVSGNIMNSAQKLQMFFTIVFEVHITFYGILAVFLLEEENRRTDALFMYSWLLGFSYFTVLTILSIINLRAQWKRFKYFIILGMFYDIWLVASSSILGIPIIVIFPTIFSMFLYDSGFVIISNVISCIVNLLGYVAYMAHYVEHDYGITFREAITNQTVTTPRIIESILLLAFGFAAEMLTKKIKEGLETTFKLEKEKIITETDIKYASAIQQNMLNSEFPVTDEYAIFADMHPAKEVGGDFYDFFRIDNKSICLVMADVSGKGIQASIYMALAKAVIKVYALSGNSVDKIIEKTNNNLTETKKNHMFVTVWIGILNLEDGMLCYTDAGHNPPIIIHSSGECEFLASNKDFVVGGRRLMRYHENQVRLNVGDKLFLYTDGVTESKNTDGEFYGEKRLFDRIGKYADITPKDCIENMQKELMDFQGEAEQYDDITMLAFEFKQYVKAKAIESRVFLTEELKQTDIATEYIKQEMTKLGCDKKTIDNMVVAVSEVVANICMYAYDENGGKCEVSIWSENRTIFVKIEDEGIQYNPLAVSKPDTTLPLNQRKRGGLGVYLIKKLTNDVKYEYKDGKNVLTLIKSY